MGAFLWEILNLKSAMTFLTKYDTFQNLWVFINEVLCICVAQGAAKLPEVKVGGPK